MKFERFEDIKAWQLARELTNKIYQLTNQKAFYKDYGLRDQIRRASVSIMSNIAEGFERDGNQEFIQFLSTAKGSAGEVRSQLYVALDEGHITKEDFTECQNKSEEISKVINGLLNYLVETTKSGRKYKD